MTKKCSECGGSDATTLGRCPSCQRHLDEKPHEPVGHVIPDLPPKAAGKPAGNVTYHIEFCHGAGKNGTEYDRLSPALRRQVSTRMRSAIKRLMFKQSFCRSV